MEPSKTATNGCNHPYIARTQTSGFSLSTSTQCFSQEPVFKLGFSNVRVIASIGSPEDDYALIAADHGLFCHRLFNRNSYDEEVFLCVHNPLTHFFTETEVPYSFEDGLENTSSNSILGGLVMDQRTGSYKLVIAFIDPDLTRETFIYDSSSDSWTVSAAASPSLGRVDEKMGEIRSRIVDRSRSCGDELFWLVRMRTSDGWLWTLIRYNMKLCTWSEMSKLWPNAEGELQQEDKLPVHLTSFENQLFLVNFNSSSERRSLWESEFINLVPSMRKFGVVDGVLSRARVTGKGARMFEWTVLAFSKNGSVTRLPKLGGVDFPCMDLCPLAATFKAFVR
ncbi:hypothetical protein R1sor_023819 [Riccia sorocarpa]|uniref:Uncharacterized protein n=1 Tax=Riccia sorocarpa TaxID=122646 RepID=A0ABD3GNV7_9MARC